jgi:hypothetical protein
MEQLQSLFNRLNSSKNSTMDVTKATRPTSKSITKNEMHYENNISGRDSKVDQGSGGPRESDEDNERFLITSKVVMLGESGVGKSSILGRFAHNTFSRGCFPTVSPHFVCKTQTIYKLGS